MAKAKPTEEALQVLTNCTIDGNVVKLPPEELPREVYTEVKKHLELIGGKWKGGKTAGFVFEYDPTDLLAAQADGEGRDLKQEYQYFPTPEGLANRMAALFTNCNPGMRILEPSAGRGALILAVQHYHGNGDKKEPDIKVDAYELMDINRTFLAQLPGVNILGNDFLEADIEGVYDCIIANPPFTKGQYITHIEKMYKALKTNGRMVVLASPSYKFTTQKKQVAFKEWLTKVSAFQEEIEAGTFQESGTNVATMLLVIDKLEVVTEVKEPTKVIDLPAPAPKKTKRNLTGNRIIINNDMLKTALKKAGDVIDAKPVLASIANLLVRVNGNSLVLVCTDLEVTLITDLTCENEDRSSFEILLPFAFIYDIVKLNNHEVLVLETDTHKASFKGLNDTYDINALDELGEFPTVPAFPDTHELKINNDFIHTLNNAFATVSKDTLRPVMMKVCLEFIDDTMYIASTNANVLYRKIIKLSSTVDEKTELVISQKVDKVLNGFTETSICWSDHHIAFKSGNLTVIATRSDEKFPNYRAVIPERTPNLILNRVELISAMEKVSLTAGDTKMTTLQLKSLIGIIRIEAKDVNKERRTYVDLPGDYNGSCESINIQADLMLKLLKQVSYENLAISVEESNKALTLNAEDDDSYLGLIMPMTI